MTPGSFKFVVDAFVLLIILLHLTIPTSQVSNHAPSICQVGKLLICHLCINDKANTGCMIAHELVRLG